MSQNNNIGSNKEICPYCQKEIEDKFFDDHMMCHEIENEEKSNNNNINPPQNNNSNNTNNMNNRNNNVNNNTNNNNTENFISSLLNIFSSSTQQNNSNNTNNRNQRRQNNSSSSNSNNTGFLSDLFNLVTNVANDINNERRNNNNNIPNNSNNSNNSNNRNNRNNDNAYMQEEVSQIGNFLSTVSKTVSTLSHLTSHLENNPNQMNPSERNNYPPPPPPPVPNNQFINPNPNFILPPNIPLMPNLIIGEPGHIFDPRRQRNNVNINNIMNLLPSSTITEKKEGEGQDNNNCIICLSDFDIGDKVTSLPCLHVFHTDCIKSWLQSKNHCPICKYEITEASLQGGN